MRRIVVISFLTLDGVMQAPGGETEDTEDGFKHGGWQARFFGDDDDSITEALGKAGALLLGRKTYDIFARYWPTEGREIALFGEIMNSLPKYVASKTLRKTEWENSNLLKGDAAEAVACLKRETGKDIYIFGSGDFCRTLMRHNLIDEYLLMIHPTVLGEGKRFFKPGIPVRDFELLTSKATRSGILVLTYRTKG